MRNTGVGEIRPTRSFRLGGAVWLANTVIPAVRAA
jgi:hypothetical protein